MSEPNTTDQYAGQGGSYELDAVTGERKLVERTEEPAAVPAEQTDAAEAAKE